jgi:hypothetical protein
MLQEFLLRKSLEKQHSQKNSHYAKVSLELWFHLDLRANLTFSQGRTSRGRAALTVF